MNLSHANDPVCLTAGRDRRFTKRPGMIAILNPEILHLIRVRMGSCP